MTALRCDACGRALAGEVAFCPYCGVDRRPASAAVEPDPVGGADAAAPIPPSAEPVVAAPTPQTPPSPAATLAPAAPVAAAAKTRTKPAPAPRKRSGCGLRLLLALMLAAGGLAWCAVHGGRSDGPATIPGAVALRPLRVSLRWRATPLPGDAAADARFAVSSTVALRVRAGGRLYTVRAGHPLRLPEDLGDGIEVRAADYVTPEAAAHARATLITLRGG